jgi:hypothetical protein
MDHRGSILGRGEEDMYFLRHSVQTGSGAHPCSYPMGIEGEASGA